MKIINLFFLIFSVLLSGCIFEAKFDFNDPRTMEKILDGKTTEEQIEFHQKVSVLLQNVKAYPPESGLQGMTYEEILNKANVVAEEVNKYNIDALRGMAVKASVSENKQVSYMKKRGRYVMPEPGYQFKTLSYNEIISELAIMEGGSISEESKNLIDKSSAKIRNEMLVEATKINPIKPRGMEDQRYFDLLGMMRDVSLHPDEFKKSCLEAYVFNATTYGGHSADEAKEMGFDLCRNELDVAQACVLKDQRRIISCLHEAVPEPS